MEDRTVIQPAASSGSVPRGARLNGIYEVGALIAHGGMGEVYRGFNIVTNDPVAIKMILPELASNPDAFALFRREASTLHNLQHEAIVRYFVFSVDPELQRAYLAMEFVDGPSLTKQLTRGPLSIDEVRILQRRLADALDVAHRAGVIHRDISSDNVILPGGDARRAKIIDFGIARSQRPGEGTIVGGGFAGKYNYVSPEQLGLAGGEVTGKSDIYSLGLVLAEALLGHPIDMSGSQAEIIEKRRKTPDLSGIDASMRPLLTAMLQPLPADRPASMAAVAAWAPAGSSRAPPAGAGRAAAIAAAIIVVVSLGGTLYVFRDSMPWGQSAQTAPPAAAPPAAAPPALPAPSAESKQELSAVSTPPADHKPPPLPPIQPSEQAASASSAAPAVAPAQSVSSEPPKHIPSADDLVKEVAKLHNPAPATVASNAPPAAEAPAASAPAEPKAPSQTALPAPAKQASESPPVHVEKMAPPTPSAPPPQLAANETPSSSHAEQMASSASAATPQGAPSASAEAPSPLKPSPPPAPAHSPPAKMTASEPAPAPVQEQKAGSTTALQQAPAPLAPASTPRAPQSRLELGLATVGEEYVADLPPFSDPVDQKGLVLHAEGDLPEGLVLADLGSGFGKISGRPNQPGQYEFNVVASNAGGATARMATKIAIAEPSPKTSSEPVPSPAPSPPPPPAASASNAATTPAERTASFLSGFDGGACFLARSLGANGATPIILGVGADKGTFQRFYEEFNRTVGVEPTLNVRLIGAAQCPALGLIGSAALSDANAPKIELSSYDVGRNKPLAGAVSNLGGRSLALLLISSDGQVHRIETRPRANGSSATFSVPIVADEIPAGVMQVVVAILSPNPLSSLANFKSGAAAEVLPRVQSELSSAGGLLGTEFFKFVN